MPTYKRPARKNPSGFGVVKGNKKERKIAKKRRTTISLFVAVVLVVVFLFLNAQAPGGVVEWAQNTFIFTSRVESWGETPLGSSARLLQTSGGNSLVLTDSAFVALNSAGNLRFNRAHGFTNPEMVTNGVRTVIFDRDGRGVRVHNLRDELLFNRTDNAIITAALSANGIMAFATHSTQRSVMSEIHIYNHNWRPITNINIHDYILADIAISDNGRLVYGLFLSARDGEISTIVKSFNARNGQELESVRFDGTLLFNISVMGNRVVVLGEDRVVSLRGNLGHVETHEFERGRLTGFDVSGDSVAVVLEEGEASVVKVISRGGRLVAEHEVYGRVSKVSRHGSAVVVARQQEILLINDNGRTSSGLAPEDTIDVGMSGRQVLVLGRNRVRRAEVE